MKSINELEKQKKEHIKKIEEIENQIVSERKREEMQGKIKIECEYCDGTGKIETCGADILSDPPEEDECPKCDGCGYIFMKPFRNRIEYYLDNIKNGQENI